MIDLKTITTPQTTAEIVNDFQTLITLELSLYEIAHSYELELEPPYSPSKPPLTFD